MKSGKNNNTKLVKSNNIKLEKRAKNNNTKPRNLWYGAKNAMIQSLQTQ